MADNNALPQQRPSHPRTSGGPPPSSASQPKVVVEPSSPLSESNSELSEDTSMPTTRSSNKPARGSAQTRGTGRQMGTRSSGRLGAPPTKLRRVITPEDEDEDMDSEEEETAQGTGGADADAYGEPPTHTGIANATEDASGMDEDDAEGEEDDDAEGEDEPKLPEESEGLTPPPPSPTPSPPKPAYKPNLRIKVKFEGKTPIKARPATARSAKGRNKLPFSGRSKEAEDSEDDPPVKPRTSTGTRGTTRTRALQAAASSTPAQSATPADSLDVTPAPEEGGYTPVPDNFDDNLEEEEMSLSPSATRRGEKMVVDEGEEEEDEEQDELEDEQPDEEEEEEEEAEEEEAVADEPEEEEESDEDEEMSLPPSGRMTARQAAMKGSGATVEFIELPTGPGKKKHLTPQEIELRKQEQSRKRSLQSAQKLEEEKQATIRRLLAKQAPKTRGSRSGVSSTTAPGSADGSATPQLPPIPTLARWVSTKEGTRWAVPPEGRWLAYVGPVKRVGPGRMQEIKGDELDDSEAVAGDGDVQGAGGSHLPRGRAQGTCAVEGCGEARKYRSVKDFEKGACGLEHLKMLNTLLA